MILASYGSGTLFRWISPNDLADLDQPQCVAALVAAVVLYSMINSGLVAGAIGLFERRLAIGRMLGSARENAVEYATLGLGLWATAFLTIQPC